MRTLSKIVENKVRRFDFTTHWTEDFEADCMLLHKKMQEGYPLAHAMFVGKRIYRYRENGISTAVMTEFRTKLNEFLYGFPHWGKGVICVHWVHEGVRDTFGPDVLSYLHFKKDEPLRANGANILEIFCYLGSPGGKGEMGIAPNIGRAFIIERK